MRFRRSLVLLAAFAAGPTLTLSDAANKDAAPAFEFRQVSYFHRWSQNDQHEFTPAKQEDLDHWTDMITVNDYPGVGDGDSLASIANKVLENYKSHEGKVLKTNSVPRTAERPAEHLIAVMFARPQFVELAFARFKLIENKGHSFVYSHRFYGEKAREEANDWLPANGDEVEKALMSWNAQP